MNQEGTHRETLRRIVVKANGDPMKAAELVGDWLHHDLCVEESDAAFRFFTSVKNEFSVNIPPRPELSAAMDAMTNLAKGDDAALERVIRERIDNRENPQFRAMAEEELRRTFFGPIMQALFEELERYDEERSGP